MKKLLTKQKKEYPPCYICGEGEGLTNSSDVLICEKCRISEALVSSYNQRRVLGGKDVGIIKSGRTFGIELESFGPRQNYEVLRKITPKDFGVGGDGSIRPADYCEATEIRTSPLQGKEGEKIITEYLTKITEDLGWKVNTSCGTHCHIGIPENAKGSVTTNDRLETLALFYAIFDPVIRALLPKDRRDNNYCSSPLRIDSYSNTSPVVDNIKKKILEYTEKNNDGTEKPKSKILHRWGGRYGINFGALNEHNTIEIRYHEGSLDPVRLIHWIALHSAIVESIMSGELTEEKILMYVKCRELRRLLTGMMLLTKKYLKASTIRYTTERFESYESLNSENGDIPDWNTPLPVPEGVECGYNDNY